MIGSVVELCKKISLENVFNPYNNRCEVHDHELSNQLRVKNLTNYLNLMKKNHPSIAWIGEALGYLGGRRTGIPFTDDHHLKRINSMYDFEFKKATTSNVRKEITAGIVWEMIAELETTPFMWNIFPFHPYDDTQLSNRRPKISEIKKTKNILNSLLDNFEIEKIYAIGRAAKKGLKLLGHDSEYIRHPSHGGANIFREQIRIKYL